MFDIVVARNNSENNKVDKDLTTIATLSGTLREGTSIIDPVFVVAADLTTFKTANYMTVSAFGRSYFIRNIQSIRNGLIELSGHVDVLSTYATQIRENNAIISRQKSDYNLYLNDGSLKVYQNPVITTQLFPGGFNTFEYVLAVAGG